jgi:hypothetical protein
MLSYARAHAIASSFLDELTIAGTTLNTKRGEYLLKRVLEKHGVNKGESRRIIGIAGHELLERTERIEKALKQQTTGD